MYSQADITTSLEVLRNGGTLLYPTDTIWGLGCDATNPVAVEKIYQIKKRADNKSMLVLLDNENSLRQYVKSVPEVAWQLIDVAETALTIIYPGARNLASNLVGIDGSIGIRITKDPFCAELIRRFRKPIVSSSANISGSTSPATFDQIEKDIKEAADHVVLWRQDDLQPGVSSSIIKIEVNGVFSIIR